MTSRMTWQPNSGLLAVLMGGMGLVISGCTDGAVVHLTYDLSRGDEGFQADIADYAVENLDFMAGVRVLPPELGRSATGLYLQSTNRSADAFMFVHRGVGASDGLEPGARYTARFAITMASDAPAGCIGIGGPPAEAVTLKVGMVDHAPVVALDGTSGVAQYRVNVDKGEQVQGGNDMTVAGDIANGAASTACGTGPTFRTFSRTHTHPTAVTASSAGELWVMIGTDSGFEGTTPLYYEQIDIELTPVR